MESLIRFQSWSSSPGDEGGERERGFGDEFGELYLSVNKRDEGTLGTSKAGVNFCSGVCVSAVKAHKWQS